MKKIIFLPIVLIIIFILFILIKPTKYLFNYDITSEWNDGYCLNFKIFDYESDWYIKFKLDDKGNIYDKWNGIISYNDGIYNISPIEGKNYDDIGFCVKGTINKPYDVESNINNDLKYSENNIDNIPNNIYNINNNLITYPGNNNLKSGINYIGDTFEYYIDINMWNIDNVDGSAKLEYIDGNFNYKHDFNNIIQKDSSGWVHGYPEIYVGKKPWGSDSAKAKVDLPIEISKIDKLIFNTKYLVNNISGGPINFAAEGWIVKDENRDSGVLNNEIEFMIKLYKEGLNPAGEKLGTFIKDIKVNGELVSKKFDLYYSKIGWDFFTFITDENYNGDLLELDLNDFIDEIKDNIDYDISKYFLLGWELGSEYGSPDNKQSKLSWIIERFDLYLNKE